MAGLSDIQTEQYDVNEEDGVRLGCDGDRRTQGLISALVMTIVLRRPVGVSTE